MRLPQIIIAAATAAALGTAGVSIAGAATSGSSAPSTATTVTTEAPRAAAGAPSSVRGRARHPWLRHRIIRRAIGISAATIGIPRADLVKELRAGKSVADVASDHSVQPQTVIDALVKAGNAALDKAKTAGKLSDARYDRLEQRLPKVAERFVNKHRTNPAP